MKSTCSVVSPVSGVPNCRWRNRTRLSLPFHECFLKNLFQVGAWAATSYLTGASFRD